MSDKRNESRPPSSDPRPPGDAEQPGEDAFKYALLYFVLPLAALIGIYAATS